MPQKNHRPKPDCQQPKVKKRLVFGPLLGVIGLLVSPLNAEEFYTRFFRDLTVGTGLHFQSWSGENNLKARELSIPLTVILPINRSLSLDVVSGTGFASLDNRGTNTLSGLTDTKLRASLIIGQELALLTAGLSTPTGKTALDEEQLQVSNIISQHALGFETANFGQGLDLNFGAATARQFGATVIGLGVGYQVRGGFTPILAGPEYTPGNELNLTLGLDQKVLDGDGTLTLDMVYTLYGEDKLAGQSIYQAGNRLLIQALGLFEIGNLNWRFHLIERIRAKNSQLGGQEPLELSNGNQLEAGVAVAKSLNTSLEVHGQVEAKLYSDNEFQAGEATLVGVGPGLRYALSPRTYLDLNTQFITGQRDASTWTGFELSGGIWIRL